MEPEFMGIICLENGGYTIADSQHAFDVFAFHCLGRTEIWRGSEMVERFSCEEPVYIEYRLEAERAQALRITAQMQGHDAAMCYRDAEARGACFILIRLA